MENETKEQVNNPAHYGGDTQYECIKVLEAWLPKEQLIGFLRGNVIKYLCRSGKKDEELQEWRKAAWYISRGIEIMQKDESEHDIYSKRR